MGGKMSIEQINANKEVGLANIELEKKKMEADIKLKLATLDAGKATTSEYLNAQSSIVSTLIENKLGADDLGFAANSCGLSLKKDLTDKDSAFREQLLRDRRTQNESKPPPYNFNTSKIKP